MSSRVDPYTDEFPQWKYIYLYTDEFNRDWFVERIPDFLPYVTIEFIESVLEDITNDTDVVNYQTGLPITFRQHECANCANA